MPRIASPLTCSDDIIHNQHFLPPPYPIRLHLEPIFAILLLVPRLDQRPRHLPYLAHGDKPRAQLQRQAGPKQEASRFQAHHDVGLALDAVEDVELERGEQVAVRLDVGEDGQDVFEEDALGGEVGELA